MTDASLPSTRSWLGLLPFAAAGAAVAVLGGLAAGTAESTYQDLDLPAAIPEPLSEFGVAEDLGQNAG